MSGPPSQVAGPPKVSDIVEGSNYRATCQAGRIQIPGTSIPACAAASVRTPAMWPARHHGPGDRHRIGGRVNEHVRSSARATHARKHHEPRATPPRIFRVRTARQRSAATPANGPGVAGRRRLACEHALAHRHRAADHPPVHLGRPGGDACGVVRPRGDGAGPRHGLRPGEEPGQAQREDQSPGPARVQQVGGGRAGQRYGHRRVRPAIPRRRHGHRAGLQTRAGALGTRIRSGSRPGMPEMGRWRNGPNGSWPSWIPPMLAHPGSSTRSACCESALGTDSITSGTSM